MEQIKDNDTKFEQHHLKVLNFIKQDDQDTADLKEEAVFNKHVNRVAKLIERLEEFEFPAKIPSTPATKLAQQLRYIKQQKDVTATFMHSPPVGGEAHPKLWNNVPKAYQCVKRIN